jgi:hypothetical protein
MCVAESCCALGDAVPASKITVGSKMFSPSGESMKEVTVTSVETGEWVHLDSTLTA